MLAWVWKGCTDDVKLVYILIWDLMGQLCVEFSVRVTLVCIVVP